MTNPIIRDLLVPLLLVHLPQMHRVDEERVAHTVDDPLLLFWADTRLLAQRELQ